MLYLSTLVSLSERIGGGESVQPKPGISDDMYTQELGSRLAATCRMPWREGGEEGGGAVKGLLRKRSFGSERDLVAAGGDGASAKRPKVDVIVIDDEEEPVTEGTVAMTNGGTSRVEDLRARGAVLECDTRPPSLSLKQPFCVQGSEGRGQRTPAEEEEDVPTDPRIRRRGPQTPREEGRMSEVEEVLGGRNGQEEGAQAERPEKCKWKTVSGIYNGN